MPAACSRAAEPLADLDQLLHGRAGEIEAVLPLAQAHVQRERRRQPLQVAEVAGDVLRLAGGLRGAGDVAAVHEQGAARDERAHAGRRVAADGRGLDLHGRGRERLVAAAELRQDAGALARGALHVERPRALARQALGALEVAQRALALAQGAQHGAAVLVERDAQLRLAALADQPLELVEGDARLGEPAGRHLGRGQVRERGRQLGLGIVAPQRVDGGAAQGQRLAHAAAGRHDRRHDRRRARGGVAHEFRVGRGGAMRGRRPRASSRGAAAGSGRGRAPPR